MILARYAGRYARARVEIELKKEREREREKERKKKNIAVECESSHLGCMSSARIAYRKNIATVFNLPSYPRPLIPDDFGVPYAQFVSILTFSAIGFNVRDFMPRLSFYLNATRPINAINVNVAVKLRSKVCLH